MASFRKTAETGFIAGAEKGWSSFIWLLKILIPISFLTLLLDYSGIIHRIDFLLKPVMRLMSLPPSAAIPLVAGMLTGIYGGIAAMTVLSFSIQQMTLIAIFLLISHNLVQEGIVQGRTGLSPLKATMVRLAASVVTVVAASSFMDIQTIVSTAMTSGSQIHKSLWEVIQLWGIATFFLSIKIFFIIMALMVSLGLMKAFNTIPFIISMLKPVLKLMGLTERVGLLWLTAVVFGIAYGSAVIMEETKAGDFSVEELERLHISIGINHSLVEDPTLFVSIGLSAVWLWIPRLITAILAVQLFNLWKKWDKCLTTPYRSDG